jgi:DNA-binding transcriptional MerR regulator
MNESAILDLREGAPGLTISKLAKLALTTRDTLLFYDRIGLLEPAIRGRNNYRYYSERELLKVSFIRTFQSLGVPLKDIGELLEKRTPETVLAILSEQMESIEEQRKQLEQAHLLLDTFRNTIEGALPLDEETITLRWCEEKPLLVGPRNDYSGERGVADNLIDAYRYFQKRVSALEINYPVWSLYEKGGIKKEGRIFPTRFYLNTPKGPDRKDAGWYVIGCARNGYGGASELFRRLFAYIEGKELELAGRSYEEYLLNEISVKDPDEYLIQVSIAVKEPPSKLQAKPRPSLR